MLPADTYSYVSSRDGTLYCSWLDHIVSSSDFHTSINNINVWYDISDEDHIPLSLSVSISSLPIMTLERNDHTARISWDSLKECEIRKYFKLTDSNFDNIPIPVDALLCKDLACSNNAHKDTLNIFIITLFIVLIIRVNSCIIKRQTVMVTLLINLVGRIT